MLAVLSRIVATEQSQAHLLENCSLRSLPHPYQTFSGDSSLVHVLKMLELGLVIVNKDCSFFLQSKNPIHYTVVFLFVCFVCLNFIIYSKFINDATRMRNIWSSSIWPNLNVPNPQHNSKAQVVYLKGLEPSRFCGILPKTGAVWAKKQCLVCWTEPWVAVLNRITEIMRKIRIRKADKYVFRWLASWLDEWRAPFASELSY